MPVLSTLVGAPPYRPGRHVGGERDAGMTASRQLVANSLVGRRGRMGVAALALLAGLWGGLVRLGLELPVGRVGAVHGPVMVLGAVGTLIALERAVALSRPWAYIAPAAAGLGALVLVAGGPPPAGRALLAVAGMALIGVFVHLYRRQPGPHFAVMGCGAALWPAAVAVWTVSGSVARAMPFL